MITSALRNSTSQPPMSRPGSVHRSAIYSPGGFRASNHKPLRDKSFSERYVEVLQYLPLVRAVALSVYAKLAGSPSIEDLIIAGVSGLFEATGDFKPGADVPFTTYAKSRIRGAMLAQLLSQGSKKEGR